MPHVAASRSRRAIALIAALLALVTVASACGSSSKSSKASNGSTSSTAPAPSGPPIVIGSIVSATGPLAAGNAGAQAGLDAWAKMTNDRGGINGRPIKLIIKDDASDPAKARTAAQELVESERVIAIVGLFSVQESTVIPYLEEKNIPVVGDILATPASFGSKVVYPEGTTVLGVVFGGIDRLAKKGVKKLALFYCAESSACAQGTALFKSFGAKVGIDVVESQAVAASAPNYAAQCLAAKQAGATAVAVLSAADTVIRVAKSCGQQGFKPTFSEGSSTLSADMLTVPELDGVGGATNTFPWFDSSTPATQEFQAAMKKYEPDAFKPGSNLYSVATANAWASAKIFGEAAKSLPATATAADVFTAMNSLPPNNTFGGLTPPLSFKQPPSAQVNCYRIVAIEAGKFVAPNGLETSCQPQ